MQVATQSSIDLHGIKKLRSGKVREVFDLGEPLLFVVTDRISAFDVILPDPIPYKGAVLNQISAFWFNRFDDILGEDLAERVKTLSLEIYSRGRDHADQCGIVVADTKFEFGTVDEDLLLIDECLTPDSSRFWPKDQYVVGHSPPSFDKQFVRDYLEALDWDKAPPAPQLPKEVIEKTSAKYVEAFRRLTGNKLSS